MGNIRAREKVRDGFLGDLPDDLQTKVMNIHRLIKDAVSSTLENSTYDDLKESRWAMSCIDDFCAMPKDKTEIGSVRVYKRGKTYRCMIQVTGHFVNHQYGWIEELLHDFIGNVFSAVRPKVRRQYDMTMTNEGKMGNAFEGFDIFPDSKTAKMIWEMFEDRKTKTIMESYCEYSDELMDYFENYRGIMSYDDYFQERSHGKLKNSFRIAMNIINGHFVKIIFDLNPNDVDQIGDHTMQQYRDSSKDYNAAKNINKVGNNDFSSRALVKAIVDMDTNENLNTVKAIGVIGTDNETKVRVPEKYQDARLGDNKTTFRNYPVNIREKIINEIKPSFPDAVTYTVGKKEVVPSYKATVIPNSISNIFLNQFGKRGRGVQNSDNRIAQMNIDKAVRLVEEQFSKMKPIIDSMNDIDIEYEVNFYQRNLAKIKSVMNDNKNEKYGQTPADPRYSRYYKNISSAISDIKSILKEKGTPINEAAEHNTDMTEIQAKKTLRTLSQDIINKTKNDKSYKVTQYTANIYANIITKNLLPKWSSGYRKLSITLDSYQSFFTFEFKIPNMSQDFISRFINGREPINAFLHRIPEIRIKMSPRIFHTMENPDDAYNFFKAAVKYYDSKIEKYSRSLTSEIMKLNHSMKHLISTTKLSGIVTYPMQLLFVFDDVHMNNPKTFELSDSDIKAINQFIKNIYSRYAAPEKEKKQIIEDVKEMVKELREACDQSDNLRDLYYLPEAVETYLFGGYNDLIERANWIFENDQVDIEATNAPKDPEVKYLQEKFGVKKLKKIPTDLVAYITIETEAIETPNDKMMIASYCLSKIEIVEWYIELLEVGSKKYVVPHSKPYLENIRTQLLACYKKIMDTKVSTNKDRPIIDIQYPKGYEG